MSVGLAVGVGALVPALLLFCCRFTPQPRTNLWFPVLLAVAALGEILTLVWLFAGVTVFDVLLVLPHLVFFGVVLALNSPRLLVHYTLAANYAGRTETVERSAEQIDQLMRELADAYRGVRFLVCKSVDGTYGIVLLGAKQLAVFKPDPGVSMDELFASLLQANPERQPGPYRSITYVKQPDGWQTAVTPA